MPRPLVLTIGSVALLATGLPCAAAPDAWDAAFGVGVVKLEPGSSDARRTVNSPPPSAPRPPAGRRSAPNQARDDAASLVATFAAALDAGATAFTGMGSIDQVVAALANGVPGGGRFADTVFRVPGLDAARQEAAAKHLRIERGRIVIGAPAQAPSPASAPPSSTATLADPMTAFAGGKLKVLVPRTFTAEAAEDGDLLLRGDGAALRIHLEATAPGLDAWGQIRAAAAGAELPIAMAGKKVYLCEPSRHAPQSIRVGFGHTLVTMKVEGDLKSPGYTQLRVSLAGIIGSLTE